MRYSIPKKIETLLWDDNDFFNHILKNSKIQSNRFPKIDQYADDLGFNMMFALAGYSPEDIDIEVHKNTITISSRGISEDAPEKPSISEDDDAASEYVRKAKVGVHKGMISRGIARRSFKLSFVIRDIFDCSQVSASMEHGLLKITVPLKEATEPRVVNIVSIMESK